jgi:hypothetical protein
MATPEKKVKARAVEVIKDLSGWWFFPQSGPYGRAGIPDIIVCYQGRFVGIECKAGTRGIKKLTKLQEREIEKIRDAGGVATVFDDSVTSSELKAIIQNNAGTGGVKLK